jgi:zinc D-Ala-D-Ala carboxypeptidase
MPYIQSDDPQKNTGLPGIKDVYHSGNVFANFVPIALWQDPQGTEAAIMSEILSVHFASNNAIISLDEESDPEKVTAQQAVLVAAGVISPEALAKGESPIVGSADTAQGVASTGTVTTSTVDLTQLTFPDSYQLSTNYTLGSMTKAPGVVYSHPVTASAGLSIAEVVANLQYLTQNCVEPIKAQYPKMFITNSFRPSGIGSSTSQHPKGMACDMQIANAEKSAYFPVATWIRDNIIFDQLLLEYKTTGSGMPWIHISFNSAGNRGQVLTFMNDKKYAVGLVDLAAT